MNIAVFVSGRGSNLKAILASAELKEICKISMVCGDKLDCLAFEVAKEHNIPFLTVNQTPKSGFVTFQELLKIFNESEIGLIVLAGFLKLMPEEFVRAFPYKIINIHPALLPSFGGKGMYGIRVHEAVFNSSAKVSGATVHFVNENYDEGLIIDQAAVSIADVDSATEIARRVLEIEHVLLPSVIAKFILKKIEINNNRVYLT